MDSTIYIDYRILLEASWLAGLLMKSPTLPLLKVIYPKHQKNQMNLLPPCFWADWAVRVVMKISAVLLEYPTFRGLFSLFSRAKEIQHNSVCTHCSIHTKKVITIKVRSAYEGEIVMCDL